jgi:signal transduction histidine kinase
VSAAGSGKQTVRLAIGNTGCKLDQVEARKAFQQFWRADDSRPSGGRHTGLGLALVHRLTTALGGAAWADVTEDGVFTVHISLGGT